MRPQGSIICGDHCFPLVVRGRLPPPTQGLAEWHPAGCFFEGALSDETDESGPLFGVIGVEEVVGAELLVGGEIALPALADLVGGEASLNLQAELSISS